MRKSVFIFCTLGLLLNACSADITQKFDTKYPVLDYSKEVRVFSLGTKAPTHSQVLGRASFKGGFLTTECSYSLAIYELQMLARQAGGNALQITSHDKPGLLNTCHSIEAHVLFIADSSSFPVK